MIRRHTCVLLLLAALTAALYAQTLDDEWHFDDSSELNWPGVREMTPEVGPAHYRGIVPLYLWALNYRMSGEEAWSYHLTNVVIHLLNAILVYTIAWALAAGAGAARSWVAVTAAVIFCAHPLATQAVTYITQRSTSLASFFVLASFLGWIAFRRRPGAARWLGLGLCLTTFGLGTFTKHVGFLTPGVIVLYEMLFPAHAAGPRRTVAIAFTLLLLLTTWRGSAYVPRVARLATGRAPVPAVPVAPTARVLVTPRHGAREYALTQPRVVATYLRMLVWPAEQNLDHHVRPSTRYRDPATAASLLLIAAALGTAWLLRRRRPMAAFGGFLFFLALLPTSTIIPNRDLMFEHRAYLSLAGFALAAADLAGFARRRWGARAWLLPGVLLVVLGTATWRRNAVWDTELSLWSDAVAKSPDKARPHVNRGLALQRAGRTEEAVPHYERTLELVPDHPLALNNLGNVRLALGDTEGADALFRRAIDVSPGYVEPRINRGNLALGQGDAEGAATLYREALELDARSVVARYNLGKCFEAQGRPAEAAAEYERVVSARPDNAQFVNDLGCAQLASGDVAAAERSLRRAVELSGGAAPSWYNLGLALEARGASGEATRAFEAALTADPALTPARDRLRALGAGPPGR